MSKAFGTVLSPRPVRPMFNGPGLSQNLALGPHLNNRGGLHLHFRWGRRQGTSLPTSHHPAEAPPSATPLTFPYAPPTAPPDAPPSATPLTSPIAAHTRSKTTIPDFTNQLSTNQPDPTSPTNLLAPLQEVARAEGLVRVHVPFSLADLSKIEKRLSNFSANPTRHSKEFRYLCQAYDLTWHDLHVILTSTLNSEERERILAAARQHADQLHLTDPAVPVGEQAVPSVDPEWDYQPQEPGRRRRDIMIQCLLAGMQAASNKIVNFDKLQEVIQHSDENPASFLNRLTQALVQFTRLDPTSLAGATVLASYFTSQSAPDIRKKFKKVEDGPQTPIQDLVKLAFKVFNSREEAAEALRQTRVKQKAALQAQALVAALQPALPTLLAGKTKDKSFKGSCYKCGDPGRWANQYPQVKPATPSGPCFKCGTTGHWAKQCPNPHPPTTPCPTCQQEGHWKSDCPASRAGIAPQRGASPQGPEGSFQLLHLDDD
uniref:CCHC-type domain-containing protein n=1 Tax=Papio anubis TaxID=9555 RepID=A0A8I5NIC0_PAPAN